MCYKKIVLSVVMTIFVATAVSSTRASIVSKNFTGSFTGGTLEGMFGGDTGVDGILQETDTAFIFKATWIIQAAGGHVIDFDSSIPEYGTTPGDFVFDPASPGGFSMDAVGNGEEEAVDWLTDDYLVGPGTEGELSGSGEIYSFIYYLDAFAITDKPNGSVPEPTSLIVWTFGIATVLGGITLGRQRHSTLRQS